MYICVFCICDMYHVCGVSYVGMYEWCVWIVCISYICVNEFMT